VKPYVPHIGPYAGRACYRHEDGTLELAPEVDSAHAPFAVALPAIPDGPLLGEGVNAGEIAGPDTRGNRGKLVESIVRNHGEQFRAWAEQKAQNATRAWDRGVRDGSIRRPPTT
jgi:hypothetical protein